LCGAHIYSPFCIQEHQYGQLRQSLNLPEHCNYLQVALAKLHPHHSSHEAVHPHPQHINCLHATSWCSSLGESLQTKAVCVCVSQMMREANDKSGPQFQRMTWDALRKSLNGLINKVNVQNIKEILPDIFREVHNQIALSLL